MHNNPSKLFRPHRPSHDHWMTIAIGRARFHISLLVNTIDKKVSVSLVLAEDSDKKYFDAILEHREEAEESIGVKLEWNRLEGKKSSNIQLNRINSDLAIPSQRLEIFAWYKDFTERFIKYFKPIIKKL